MKIPRGYRLMKHPFKKNGDEKMSLDGIHWLGVCHCCPRSLKGLLYIRPIKRKKKCK